MVKWKKKTENKRPTYTSAPMDPQTCLFIHLYTYTCEYYSKIHDGDHSNTGNKQPVQLHKMHVDTSARLKLDHWTSKCSWKNTPS